MINYRTLMIWMMMVWLLSACQPDGASGEPVVGTPTAATATAIESTTTPTQPPLVPPTLTEIPSTPDISPGQETPGSGPPDAEGRVGWVRTDTSILRTRDGGRSWQDVTPDGIQEAISSASAGSGARLSAAFSEGGGAMVAILVGDRVKIYRTADAGERWDEAELVLQEEIQGITSMAMVGDVHGWLLATRGVGAGNDWVDLYHTQDGGASWSFLSGSESEANPAGGISSGGLKTGLSFSSPERGWLTGSAPMDLIYLFRTLDGGRTWQADHLPLPENASFSDSTYPPITFDEQNGVLPARVITLTDEPGLLFYRTRDAGESWEPVVMLEGPVTAWDWLDPQHGYAAGTDENFQTKIYRTRDGGTSWEAFPVDLDVISELKFSTQEEGWAICGWAFEPLQNCSGDLYRTADGGRSWERVNLN
jgi:photosystem II stability/assembly factor-like uncharacterized protein